MRATIKPAVSLVVATFGRADVLERLVASLTAQSSQDFEIIVADQNRDDRVRPLIAPLAASGQLTRHIRLEVANLSAARNAGLAAATINHGRSAVLVSKHVPGHGGGYATTSSARALVSYRRSLATNEPSRRRAVWCSM